MIFGSKGQRSRLGLGLLLQKKHIKGARVAGVSYALYRVLSLVLCEMTSRTLHTTFQRRHVWGSIRAVAPHRKLLHE